MSEGQTGEVNNREDERIGEELLRDWQANIRNLTGEGAAIDELAETLLSCRVVVVVVMAEFFHHPFTLAHSLRSTESVREREVALAVAITVVAVVVVVVVVIFVDQLV